MNRIFACCIHCTYTTVPLNTCVSQAQTNLRTKDNFFSAPKVPPPYISATRMTPLYNSAPKVPPPYISATILYKFPQSALTLHQCHNLILVLPEYHPPYGSAPRVSPPDISAPRVPPPYISVPTLHLCPQCATTLYQCPQSATTTLHQCPLPSKVTSDVPHCLIRGQAQLALEVHMHSSELGTRPFLEHFSPVHGQLWTGDKCLIFTSHP